MKQHPVITSVLLLSLAVITYLLLAHTSININGADYSDSGSVFGVLIAGGVMVAVALFLIMLFAGLGLFMCIGIALLCILLATCLLPLLMPLALPVLLVWFVVVMLRKNKQPSETCT